jgi:hypothetical protein
LVVEPSLQVAVAVYCDVVLSFTDAAPLIAMLVKVGTVTAPVTVKVTGTRISPWFVLVLAGAESYEFPNQAAVKVTVLVLVTVGAGTAAKVMGNPDPPPSPDGPVLLATSTPLWL